MARPRQTAALTPNKTEPDGPGTGHPEGASVWGDPPVPPEGHIPPCDGPDIDDEPDAVFDGDSDAEDFDEDGMPTEDNPDGEDDGARKPSAPASAGSAALDESRIYKLSVFSRDDGSMGCEYDAAPWHETISGNPTVDFNTCNRTDFLRACASWLETQKNGFLQTRRIHEYLTSETADDYCTDPLVTAKGFLLRINPLLPKEGRVPGFSLSRILPHVWLIWDGGISMPLMALFSEEVKMLWVVKGCRLACSEPSVWQKIVQKEVKIRPKEKSRDVVVKAFEKQELSERCLFLFKRAGLRAAEDLNRVIDLLSGNGGPDVVN